MLFRVQTLFDESDNYYAVRPSGHMDDLVYIVNTLTE